ncbi:MAG: bile acid:sodium symporter family protein [Nocardioides sp.]|nr:bile acid:sodium symporter family protein [Nocardioides sp.]
MLVHLALVGSSVDDIEVAIPEGLAIGTKVLIAAFLFAVALEVRWGDMREAARQPWVFAAGLVTQFVVIPALTLLLIAALDVPPSVGLGLLLVACCPAGNLSNLLTYRARGDLPLSISMTTVSNGTAVVVTPVALAFWGSLSPRVTDTLAAVELSPVDVLRDVGLLIMLPFAAGILVAHRRPGVAAGARRFVEPAVVTLLAVLVLGGLVSNAGTVVEHVLLIGPAVVLQNLVSLGAGYAVATACRLSTGGRRAMTLEMGIRNTALGLVLAITFFPTLGGVAVTVALWGLWDLITGGVLSSWWRRRTPAEDAPDAHGDPSAPAARSADPA